MGEENKSPSVHEDERAGLPWYHLGSPDAISGALTPDSHQGCAVTGLPVPVYSPYGFLRHTFRATFGNGLLRGLPADGPPSLSARRSPTPPGRQCIRLM
jgi:hypothetical protein